MTYFSERLTGLSAGVQGEFDSPEKAVEHFKKLYGEDLLVVYDDDLKIHFEAKEKPNK